jgi:gamma-glutamylcyclotransferase (GGCT)/AIG2-like uncharacterized protein YtfP
MQKVCVYGTLKKGKYNHPAIKDSKFVGECLLENYNMHTLGSFPGIKPGKGTVVGEVYEVDDKTLYVLDRIEGHPHFYKREIVKTPLGESWVYILPDADRYPLHESGIW